MSLSLLNNKKLVIDSSDKTGWTVNGSNIENITSLEGTGVTIEQLTAANQPVVNADGNIEVTNANQYLSADTSLVNSTSFISWRFKILSENSQGDFFVSRGDSVGYYHFFIDQFADDTRLNVETRNKTFTRNLALLINQWNTFSIAFQPDAAPENDLEVKFLFNDEVIETGHASFGAGTQLFRIFGNGSSSNLDMETSHLIFSHDYPNDSDFQTLHNFVKSGFTGANPTGPVTFEGAARPNAPASILRFADLTQASFEHVEDVLADGNGDIIGTIDRDPTKHYMFVARDLASDYTGTIAAVSGTGDVEIDTGLDLSDLNMGTDHYVFRATSGSNDGDEVTVLSRSGNTITLRSNPGFQVGDGFVFGRVLKGTSDILLAD